MKRFALDFVIVTLIVLAGFAVTKNLDSPVSYGFCVFFGVGYATVRWTYRRRARSHGIPPR